MVYIILCLLLGTLMIVGSEALSKYSIAHLIQRYREKKENEVVFELLGRYQNASNKEKGDMIFGLLEPHKKDLARIIISMNEDPDEELQKLYIKLHELFMNGKFPYKNWKYWLARILKNDLLNIKKRNNPFIPLPIERLPEVEEEEKEETLSVNSVEEAIRDLSETQRMAVELRYLTRGEKLMSYKEIAAAMNCSVGQVHGYLDRAKENLRNKMAANNNFEL